MACFFAFCWKLINHYFSLALQFFCEGLKKESRVKFKFLNIVYITIVLSVSSVFSAANAGLITDNVDFARYWQGNPIAQQSAVVGSGVEFSERFIAVDISDNMIMFDWLSNVGYSTGSPIQYYRIWNMDWVGGTGSITEVNVDFANITGFDASNVTFGSDYIEVAIGGLSMNNNSFINIELNSTSVPEPSTLAIFALGIIGLASRRFKKQS